MKKLLVLLALISGNANGAVMSMLQLPGGATGQLQYNGGPVFLALPGSIAGSTGTLTLRDLNVVYGIRVGTITAGAISGAVSPSSVDLSTVTSRFNQVAVSTVALGVSTGAIAGRVSTLEVWQGTDSVNSATLSASTVALRDSFSAFVSTAGPLVATLGQSTGSLRSDFSGFVSTAGPLVATLGQSTGSLRSDFSAFVSTAGPLVATLGQSTNTIATNLTTHAALTGSSAHGATSANTASQIVTRDASGAFSAGQGTFAGGILSGDGSAATPGFAFTTKPDMGMFRETGNTLGLGTSGVQRVSISQSNFYANVPFRNDDGSASFPVYSFNGDTNTGLYRDGTDSLSVSAGGSQRAAFGVSTTDIFTSTFSVGTSSFVVAGGSATVAYGLTVGTRLSASSATLTGTSGAYDLTLSTGMYLSAGEVRFNSGAGGVVWPDGTRTVTATSASSVYYSSFGVISSQTPNFTATGPCVAGSTRTFTPTGTRIDIINMMSGDQGNSGQDCAGAALLDGNYLPGWTSAQGIRAFQNGYVQNFSWTIPSVAVTAGASHTVCLMIFCGSSGPTICGAGSSWTNKCIFGVREAVFTPAN